MGVLEKPLLSNSVRAAAADMVIVRRDLHAHPELMYEETRTAGIVARQLREFGFDEVHEGIGKTGVVGILHGQGGAAGSSEQRVLLRADMDALPIVEATGAEYTSTEAGRMHACGHDGHTAMLLGAAKVLSASRNFEGTLVFCFQPAEEGGAGAKAMIDDGMLDRWPVKSAFGVHNRPGLEVGRFAARSGPVMASADGLDIVVEGVGGHAARPAACKDPIVAAGDLIGSLQSIVSRRIPPIEPAVISITAINAGEAYNVIPQTVSMKCSFRAFKPEIARQLLQEIHRVCDGVAAAHGVSISAKRPSWATPYPATINTEAEVTLAMQAMIDVAGEDGLEMDFEPMTGSEDFSFILEKVPGAYVFVGNGNSSELHHPSYDFNDGAIAPCIAFWSRLVERALPLSTSGSRPDGEISANER